MNYIINTFIVNFITIFKTQVLADLYIVYKYRYLPSRYLLYYLI